MTHTYNWWREHTPQVIEAHQNRTWPVYEPYAATPDDDLFMPILLSVTTDGTNKAWDESGPVTVTTTGALRYVDGPYPRPAPGTINYISNPKAATGTTNIVVLASGVNTRVLEATGNPIGSNTYRLQTVSSASLNSGTRYRGITVRGRIVRQFIGGIWVKGIAGATLTSNVIAVYIGGASTLSTAKQFIATGGWQWVTTNPVTTSIVNDLDYVGIEVKTNPAMVTTFSTQGATVIDGIDPPTGPFDGSSTDARWIGTADASNSIRSAFLDQAFMLEEAVTNYAVNPYAVSSGGGWAPTAGVTRTYLTDANMPHPDGMYINTAARFTWTTTDNTGQNLATRAYTTIAGEVITGSVLVRASGSAIGKTFRLSIYENATVDSTDVVLTGAPQLVSITATLVGGQASIVLLGYFATGSVSGDILDMTAGQIEYGTRTSLTPALSTAGSPLSGYAWTGTAHNSTSTRAAAVMTAPAPAGFTTVTGSAIFRAFLTPQASTFEHTIWGVNYEGGGSSKDGFFLRVGNAAATIVHFYYQNSAGTFASAAGTGFTPNAWNTIYIEWDATTFSIFNADGTKTTTARVSVVNNINAQPFRWGSRPSGPDRFLNAGMGPSMFFDRALSDEEKTIATSMMNGWAVSPLP